MADDNTVHIEGYALTHDTYGRWGDERGPTRRELERAVARQPTVPLRAGDRIIGKANLSVDDTGLRVVADLEPLGFRAVGHDEGIPYGDRVHDTNVPEAVRLGLADLSVSLRPTVSIEDVSIVARPAEEVP